MEVEISSETIGGILKFLLRGQLLAKDAKQFAATIKGQLPDRQQLLFDLAELSQIDYDGLRAFLQVLQWAHRKECTVVLVAIQPVPRILFDITRVSQVFRCVETTEEALAALNEPTTTELAR